MGKEFLAVKRGSSTSGRQGEREGGRDHSFTVEQKVLLTPARMPGIPGGGAPERSGNGAAPSAPGQGGSRGAGAVLLAQHPCPLVVSAALD